MRVPINAVIITFLVFSKFNICICQTNEKPQNGIHLSISGEDFPKTILGRLMIVKDGENILERIISAENAKSVTDIPAGKAEIYIFPYTIGKEIGIYGKTEVTIPEEGIIEVTIKVKKIEGKPCKIKIFNEDGGLFSNTSVLVRDVSEDKIKDNIENKEKSKEWTGTNEDGIAQFYVFPGRKYRLSAWWSEIPGVSCTSDIITEDSVTNIPITWKLERCPHIEIRFFTDAPGQKEPFPQIKSVSIRTDKTSWSVSVKNACLRINKDSHILEGATKVFIGGWSTENREINSRDFEIIGNKEFRIDDSKKQIIDVFITKRKNAKLSIQCTEEDSGKKLKASVFAKKKDSEKFINLGMASNTLEFQPGIYDLFIWSPKHILFSQEIELSAYEIRNLDASLKQAPLIRGKVSNPAGEPIKDCYVKAIYLDAIFIQERGVMTKADGFFEIPMDRNLQLNILIEDWCFDPKASKYATRIITNKEITDDKLIEVKMQQGCKAIGNIKVDPKCDVDKIQVIKWFNSKIPEEVIYASLVEDGKYHAYLYPGKYRLTFCSGRKEISLDEVDIPDKDSIELGNIIITPEIWSK
jgi:hypothetical protein